MKLGILGGTTLANTLGKKYIHAGLTVVFGVRHDFDTENEEWKMLNRLRNRICPYESAIIQAEIILICCENSSLQEICAALENVDTHGKLLIDCTESHHDDKLAVSNTRMIKKAAPKAHLFGAFNNLGIDYPLHDPLRKIKETYYCGEDIPDKIRVKRLIELIGFKAIDITNKQNEELTEQFCLPNAKLSGKTSKSSARKVNSAA
ncbi:NAD(P)-binding domain-containing protein [Algoriphagus mannitolivorans]|uniref:NAD(P)-binding domain-containing protein n=1 Tax=Algoriphagus mannitolivorans TaxID=226504 RepID=UPI00041BA706|nr:NAD(P)-binding domain-containing protein [Algoriphagus mannitolivorans]